MVRKWYKPYWYWLVLIVVTLAMLYGGNYLWNLFVRSIACTCQCGG